MPQFLIELPHTNEECMQAMNEVSAKGSELLGKVAWGCNTGTHTGWAWVEAMDADEARDMITGAVLRPKARVTEVVTYTPEEIARLHAA